MEKLEELLKRINCLSGDLQASVCIRPEVSHIEESKTEGSFEYTEPIISHPEEGYIESGSIINWVVDSPVVFVPKLVTIVDSPAVYVPDLERRGDANKELRKIADTTEWHSARYFSKRVLLEDDVSQEFPGWIGQYRKDIDSSKDAGIHAFSDIQGFFEIPSVDISFDKRDIDNYYNLFQKELVGFLKELYHNHKSEEVKRLSRESLKQYYDRYYLFSRNNLDMNDVLEAGEMIGGLVSYLSALSLGIYGAIRDGGGFGEFAWSCGYLPCLIGLGGALVGTIIGAGIGPEICKVSNAYQKSAYQKRRRFNKFLKEKEI